MKQSLVMLALLAALGAAHAQSDSTATSGSAASSNPVLNNAGNGSSTSSSGATVSGVASSSNPNNQAQQSITFNQPVVSTSTNTSTNHSTVDGTSTQRLEGGTNSTVHNIQEGVSTQRVEYAGTQTVKNVPAIAMSGPASGPCTGASGGLGLAGPGWGIGLNGSAVMDDCRLRENARVLGMGMQSIDGGANPQEKAEVTVMFMDSMRALAQYNATIYNRTSKDSK